MQKTSACCRAEASRLHLLHEAAEVQQAAILPGLPNEVALLILARLPRALHGPLRSVSRAWRHALHPSTITPLRHALAISETWIAIALKNNSLAIYDPTLSRLSSPLPYPVAALDHILVTVMGVLGNEILVKEETESLGYYQNWGYVHSFDVASMRVHLEMGPFPAQELCEFLTVATLGNYVYVPGLSRTVRRLDLTKKLVETLPEMHVERDAPVCVVLEGQVCVISNRTGKIFSGEIWDPHNEGHWTLVPELWPSDIFGAAHYGIQQKVVVLADTLYAIRSVRTGHPRSEPQLMCYDTSTKHWNNLGFLPKQTCKFCVSRVACLQLLAVGNELWVFLSGHHQCHMFQCHKEWLVEVFACVPASHKCLAWKTSYISLPIDLLPASFSAVKV